MLLVCALLSLVVWAVLFFSRGDFWRSGPVLPPATPTRWLRVTAVIPARDEAEHIEATLRSLLAQEFGGVLQVVLVDDNSTDGTGALAEGIGATDARLRVVPGRPLEPGWSGKMWAVSQGLEQPEARAADYVLLTDADIVHAPGHLAALLAHAEQSGHGLVSEMVRLRCETFEERATLPAFVFFFAMLYPFAWVNDPKRRTAAAAGGTMLVSGEALRRVDGVSRIRTALIDDVALAQQVKREGFTIWLGHGELVKSDRRYEHLREVWDMIARTAYVQLRYSPWLLLGTVLGMLLLYVVPVWGSVSWGEARWISLSLWVSMALAFQPTLRRYRLSPVWGVALPGIAVFYLLATIGSAVWFYRGTGGRWKDRTYTAGDHPG